MKTWTRGIEIKHYRELSRRANKPNVDPPLKMEPLRVPVVGYTRYASQSRKDRPVIDLFTREEWPSATAAANALGSGANAEQVRSCCYRNRTSKKECYRGKMLRYLDEYLASQKKGD